MSQMQNVRQTHTQLPHDRFPLFSVIVWWLGEINKLLMFEGGLIAVALSNLLFFSISLTQGLEIRAYCLL